MLADIDSLFIAITLAAATVYRPGVRLLRSGGEGWENRPRVSDLTPLKGMHLGKIIFTPANITKGIEIVRGMKRIVKIGINDKRGMKPKAFWKKYDAGEFK